MRYRRPQLPAALVLLAGLALAPAGFGQYREYYLYGKVIDTQKKPLEGVEINLRDVATSRSYNMMTKKDGQFKFVGLPHGVYKVVFKKDGYAMKEDEWKFETPQPALEKVEIPPVTMVSQEVVQESQRLKAAESGVKTALEKIRLGDYDGAIPPLKAVLQKNPRDSNAFYLIGLAYLRKNMLAEASAAFLQVTALAPRFAPAYYQLGVCHQQQKEPEKALEFYQRAIELDPANPDSPFYAGVILFGMSRIEEALALFEKTLSLKPDDPAALEMAGRCYAHQANFPKAVEYLEKAKAGFLTDPEHVKFLDGLITNLKEQIKK
ncbi:MAG: tetratricopeptide repeat protein [Candidatus Aminicenantales bacterium]|jgi:tetratricopeptide (TPR) repeat protein